MAKEREYFVDGMVDEDGNVVIDGCVRRGVPRQVAEHIYDEMTSFASYAFNKSHAAAYAHGRRADRLAQAASSRALYGRHSQQRHGQSAQGGGLHPVLPRRTASRSCRRT